ncbi:hypothetical protein F5Y15DRAFT_401254 [Xylariaceae sp. FL0016]|nr:hypothetical protein F5Y15DRAFT_401254 [Xylariaceae sp. FL0016]
MLRTVQALTRPGISNWSQGAVRLYQRQRYKPPQMPPYYVPPPPPPRPTWRSRLLYTGLGSVITFVGIVGWDEYVEWAYIHQNATHQEKLAQTLDNVGIRYREILDARAAGDEPRMGQLVREIYGEMAALIGFEVRGPLPGFPPGSPLCGREKVAEAATGMSELLLGRFGNQGMLWLMVDVDAEELRPMLEGGLMVDGASDVVYAYADDDDNNDARGAQRGVGRVRVEHRDMSILQEVLLRCAKQCWAWQDEGRTDARLFEVGVFCRDGAWCYQFDGRQFVPNFTIPFSACLERPGAVS